MASKTFETTVETEATSILKKIEYLADAVDILLGRVKELEKRIEGVDFKILGGVIRGR